MDELLRKLILGLSVLKRFLEFVHPNPFRSAFVKNRALILFIDSIGFVETDILSWLFNRIYFNVGRSYLHLDLSEKAFENGALILFMVENRKGNARVVHLVGL